MFGSNRAALRRRISRRSVLRLMSLSLTRAMLPPMPPINFLRDGAPAEVEQPKQLLSFARAITWGVPVRSEPNFYARTTDIMVADSVLPLYAAFDNDQGTAHNPTWYEVQGGYVHSAHIQPVSWYENEAVKNVLKGAWGEVTVPFTDSRVAPSLAASRTKYRYYGGTTYRIIRAVPSVESGSSEWWYQIEDEEFPANYFVPAKHMRVVPAEEFAPLSQDVDPREKKVIVKLGEQRVHAYEGNREVFTARAATGHKFDDKKRDFRTPPGQYVVFRKTPSQHMHGGKEGEDDYYDLPGVPWVSYFTGDGIAFHGAYWHNDYGVTRSHGCINVTPQNSKWLWRWLMPANDMNVRYTMIDKTSQGTLVQVVN